MQTLDGFVAKGGAEGLICAAGPDGFAVSLKSEDGAYRPLRAAAASFLAGLGFDLGSYGESPLRNTRNEVVGELAILR